MIYPKENNQILIPTDINTAARRTGTVILSFLLLQKIKNARLKIQRIPIWI